jgi:hypothetical protein
MAAEGTRRRFFDRNSEPSEGDGAAVIPLHDPDRATAVAYDEPRAIAAAAQILDLRMRGVTTQLSRTHAWQEAAWGYYDQVGELKFAFNLISQIVSRALLYGAVIEDASEVPVEAKAFLTKVGSGENATEGEGKVAAAVRIADEALRDLFKGSQAELLRLFALNLSIPGECYLVNDEGKWIVASISELTPGDPPRLRHTNNASPSAGSTNGGKALPKDAYVARIWRSHPRWSGEADSSMLGVLDQVEKVVLFDQVSRTISRSRLGAGIVFIPGGLTPIGGKPLEEAIIEVTTKPVEDESVAATVTPLLLTGPPELGEKIRRIDLAREIDEEMTKLAEDAMDRILAGLDIPKNIVAGLQDTRYSNAIVIDDALYKAHIEPLILMICDALTQAYLRPTLRKAGVEEQVVQKLVVWYNPAAIVTRPDRSQAANEGYDKYLLSGETWRRARGFSDLDAPSEEEILFRMALEQAQIPPEISTLLIEAISPEFFGKARGEAQAEAGVPPEVDELLRGGPVVTPAQPTESDAMSDARNGAEVKQGGPMPTRPDNLQRAQQGLTP